ncbi:hypothetical protein BDQ17DRAFT_1432598 [Cyathus striatus]|nr:hypothetical protein BDQ17DRAFT_1432598 [Cyathus striatus]
MDIPLQSYLPWKISVTILHVTAVATACLRINYRRRTRRLWWDDYAASVPAFTECFNAAFLWIRLRHFSDEEDALLREMKVTLSFLNSGLFATTIWWSRISMALAIVRISPEWSKSRIITLFATSAFIFNWITLVVSFTVVCALRSSWQHSHADVLICGPATMITIASIAMDIIGDVYLAALPLYRLWRLRLPLAQRRLIRLVFSTSLLTLPPVLLVLVWSYGGIIRGPGFGLVWIMLLQMEEAISVIANNLTVLIAWCYKSYSGDIDVDAESNKYVNPHWTTSSPLVLPSVIVIEPFMATFNHAPNQADCNTYAADSLGTRSLKSTQADSNEQHICKDQVRFRKLYF